MNKFRNLLALLLAVMMILSMAACGKDAPAASDGDATPVTKPAESKPDIAETAPVETEMSYEELVAAAQAEGTLVMYGANSYLQTAADNFQKQFGINVEFTQLGETEMVEKVSGEAATGAISVDLVMQQDPYRVMAQLINPGYVENWSNSRIGQITGNEDCTALVWYYDTKSFMYNPELTGEGYLSNLWIITDPANYGQFSMKDPTSEGVNYNMLTMLTSDTYAKKLAEAYKDYYGTEITLTTENAGWEFIKKVYENGVVLTTSDSTSAKSVGAKGQNVTWVGYFSTQRYTIQEKNDLLLSYDYDGCSPVCGYSYPVYALVMKGCAHPNAAKLFAEWILSAEGWDAFADYYGGYSANPANVYATDYSYAEVLPYLVVDDPDYLVAVRADMEDFLESLS